MENIRLFVGIPCPSTASGAISALMDRMAGSLRFRKWTHPADLHVTLHFIGDTPPQRLEAIGRALEETAAQFAPFALRFAGPGTFGPPDAPRILWLGVKEQGAPGRLAALHEALRPGLIAAGCRLDGKPFRAHMTLARQGDASCAPEKIRAAWEAARSAQTHAAEWGPWTVSGITLFRSHLGRRPSYEALRHYLFRGNPPAADGISNRNTG